MINLQKPAGAILAAFFVLGAGHTARAQENFPSKPIRMIVPFSAGGTADVLTRVLAQRLGTLYGQQILVDNRPGAGGHIAAELAPTSPPHHYPPAPPSLPPHPPP